jgi:thiamine biosynthesis lipoprotein
MRTLYKQAMPLMGCHFEISAVSSSANQAKGAILAAEEEMRRIERLLTTYNEDSETSLINRNAGGHPVNISRETFDIIRRSIRISELTAGAFDITYGGIDKNLWNFDTSLQRLPSAETAKKMIRLINFRNILLDPDHNTALLKEKGMRINFGGIGKGYAAERAKIIMLEMGIDSGIVNASGDLAIWGTQPDGQPWTIGIVHPDKPDQAFCHLKVNNMALATSGNYEKFALIGGKRYSHTINPRTGLPVTGIKSVTIITPNAEIADAMATPVMIMGIEAGLNMIDQMKDIEAVLIDDDNNLFTSRNIHLS